MATLFLASVNGDDILKIFGIVIAVIEGFIVLTKFLQFFIEPDSKFGIFLSRALKGFIFLRGEVKSLDDKVQNSNQGNIQPDEKKNE